MTMQRRRTKATTATILPQPDPLFRSRDSFLGLLGVLAKNGDGAGEGSDDGDTAASA